MSKITFPESLYEQYKDQFVQRPPKHLYLNESFGLANTAVNSPVPWITVPNDMDCIINVVSMRARAGAAQTIVNAFFQINPPPGSAANYTRIYLVGSSSIIAGDAVGSIADGLMIEAGSSFQFTAQFNAGVALNSVECGIMICFYPRMKF